MPTTWNPNDKNSRFTLSNGNLTATYVTGVVISGLVRATQGLYLSGKGYFEARVDVFPSISDYTLGVATRGHSLDGKLGDGNLYGWGFQILYGTTQGRIYHSSASTYGVKLDVGDIFQCAVDAGNGLIWFGKNNTWMNSSDPAAGTGAVYSDVTSAIFPAFSSELNTNSTTARFAAADQSYSPPSGFSAWDDVAAEHAPGKRLIDLAMRRDIQDGGAYRITGTVDELGVPGPYLVRLFDRISGRCLRETWSAADGTYSFNDLAYRSQGYFAIAYDHGDNPLNAAIADLVTPEAMP